MVLLLAVGLLVGCGMGQSQSRSLTKDEAVRIVESIPETIAYASRINAPVMILEERNDERGITLSIGEDRRTRFVRGMTVHVDHQRRVFMLVDSVDRSGKEWRQLSRR